MFGKRQPLPDEARRRPTSSRQSRGRNFSYYAQSRSVRGTTEQSVARRQPIPRDKGEIFRYIGQRFGVILAVVAALALIFSSLQVSMTPRIKVINNTSVYRIHSDLVYQTRAAQALRSSWTNTNKITINTDKIASDLQQEYPEIADASVTLPVLGQRPVIYLQLTRPSLVVVSTSGAAYVLDEAGRVLAPASQVENLDDFELPTISDESGLRLTVGQLALPQATVTFITEVLYQLHRAGISYSKLTLPQASQELDVGLESKDYFVKFNTHSATAREQAGSYLAVQATLDKHSKMPAKYIDARLPGRVYYK